MLHLLLRLRNEVTVPADPAVDSVSLAPRGTGGLHGWPVSLAVSDVDETLEKEPNNEAAKANRISMPGIRIGRCGISARARRRP